MAVEDQLVLAAHRVAERDEAGVVSRARDEHLLALVGAADVERRRRDVDEQLRAGQREVGRGWARLPHVLADSRPDERLAVLEQNQVATRCEVAVLVEDAVVRQEALAVDAADLAAGEHEAGVVEVGVEVGGADERRDPVRLARELLDRALRRPDEPRPQEQVLGRVAGDGELGEEDEVGARLTRLGEPGQDPATVAVEVADDGVDLRECESHPGGFLLSIENSTGWRECPSWPSS